MAALSAAFERAGGGVPQTGPSRRRGRDRKDAHRGGVCRPRARLRMRRCSWVAAAKARGRPPSGRGSRSCAVFSSRPNSPSRRQDLRRLAPVLAQMVPEVGHRLPETRCARRRWIRSRRAFDSSTPSRNSCNESDPNDRSSSCSTTCTARIQLRSSWSPSSAASCVKQRCSSSSPTATWKCSAIRLGSASSRSSRGRSRVARSSSTDFRRSKWRSSCRPRHSAARRSSALAQTLHEQSGGNPFFLTQLVHLLEAEGSAAAIAKTGRARLLLPGGVREAIARQLDGLPEDTRRALRVAATVGREFSATAISEVLGLPVPRLIAALEAALDARMVVAFRSIGSFSFRSRPAARHHLRGSRCRRARHPPPKDCRDSRTSLRRRPRSACGRACLSLPRGRPYRRDRVRGPLRRARGRVGRARASRTRTQHATIEAHFRFSNRPDRGTSYSAASFCFGLGEVEMHAGERDRARKALYDAAALAKRAGHPRSARARRTSPRPWIFHN